MPIELWTDGACSGNPGPGGWAYVILDVDGTEREGSGSDPATTNNRMEMTAAIEGLRAITVPSDIQIVTDSAYLEQPFTDKWIVGWEQRGWRRKGKNGKPAELKNAELWRALVAEIRRHRRVSWRRIRGHVGHPLNERCDELAVAATLVAGGSPGRMVELRGREDRSLADIARQANSDRTGAYGSRTGNRRQHPKADASQLSVFNVASLSPEERKRYGF